MKITPNAYRPALPEQRTVPPSAQKNPTTGQAKPNSSASVELSPAARHLSKAQETSKDIDMNRVNAMRDAIANGSLRIDVERIADGLLTSARELLA